jgi:hypothetical protein
LYLHDDRLTPVQQEADLPVRPVVRDNDVASAPPLERARERGDGCDVGGLGDEEGARADVLGGLVMLCYVMVPLLPPRQLCRRQLGVAASCDICSVGGAAHE